MKQVVFLLLILALPASKVLGAGLPGAVPQALTFTTQDHMRIAALWYHDTSRTRDTLVLVAPGFAQDSSLAPMRAVCEELSPSADVLCLDFRGTGKSSGHFWFGAREYRDLRPGLDWAHQRYPQVVLLGFSLGAYSAVRAACLWPQDVQRLMLVSCPTSLNGILWTGGIFANLFTALFTHPMLKIPGSNNLFFRWGFPLGPKPNARDLVRNLKMPVDFLAGSADHLIYPWLSHRVYEAAPEPKTWTLWKGGIHAEGMNLQDPARFTAWVLWHLGGAGPWAGSAGKFRGY